MTSKAEVLGVNLSEYTLPAFEALCAGLLNADPAITPVTCGKTLTDIQKGLADCGQLSAVIIDIDDLNLSIDHFPPLVIEPYKFAKGRPFVLMAVSAKPIDKDTAKILEQRGFLYWDTWNENTDLNPLYWEILKTRKNSNNPFEILGINLGSAKKVLGDWYKRLPGLTPSIGAEFCDADACEVSRIVGERGHPSAVIINLDGLNLGSTEITSLFNTMDRVLDPHQYVLIAINQRELAAGQESYFNALGLRQSYSLGGDEANENHVFAELERRILAKIRHNRSERELNSILPASRLREFTRAQFEAVFQSEPVAKPEAPPQP